MSGQPARLQGWTGGRDRLGAALVLAPVAAMGALLVAALAPDRSGE
jgi:hypothetical protein